MMPKSTVRITLCVVRSPTVFPARPSERDVEFNAKRCGKFGNSVFINIPSCRRHIRRKRNGIATDSHVTDFLRHFRFLSLAGFGIRATIEPLIPSLSTGTQLCGVFG